MNIAPTVYVVDDDPGIIKSMRWLIESAQLPVKTFSSGLAFLEYYEPGYSGCLVLDMQMPGMNGLDVQRCLAARGAELPIIVMTAHADIAACVESFKSGIFDFIEKPADDELLLNRIHQAMAADARRRELSGSRSQFAAMMADLSPREIEVMHLVADGRTLKQIALELGVSIQTSAKHRARMLNKLKLENDVALVRLMMQIDPCQLSAPRA